MIRAIASILPPMSAVPRIRQTVLDARDVRALAEFYRELLGLRYRPGDEAPSDGSPDELDWLVLRSPDGAPALAFQQNAEHRAPTWPDPGIGQQLHLDTTVPTRADLEQARRRALELGARELLDRSEDPEEPLYVLADPAGHPLCIFVAAS